MKKKICKLKLAAFDRGDRLDLKIRTGFEGTRGQLAFVVSGLFTALELTQDEASRISKKAVELMDLGVKE